MPMSTDRVEFVIDPSCAVEATRAAFVKAFKQELRGSMPLTVRCRPSQFARFLIYRNDLGGRNSFKELSPRLVRAYEYNVLDVSTSEA